ncbi:MAG: hypothetical protein FJ278_06465, partial [Planctomycetes bacterium]|nr:hypothetical protein [Planctomycetota bacterium]
MATESVGHKIVRAMFVVGFFWLFWKFGGFLIMGILAKFFPPSAGPIADAYAMTYNMVIFTALFATVLKVIVPAFMPIFIEMKEKASEEEAWKLANTVLNLLILGGLLAVCAGMLYPETVLETLAPGFGDRTRAVAADLLRMMLPGAFLLLVGTMALALLNSYKVFGYPAAGDALQKFLWAGVLIGGIMGFRWGAEAIAYGFLVGCVGQTIINLVGIGRKLRFYRPDLPLLRGSRIVKELGILACFLTALWLCQFLCLVFANALEAVYIDKQLAWLTGALLISCGYCILLWHRTKNSPNPIGRFAALAGPILISILFARYRDLVTSLYQTYTKAGVFASFRFARSIGDFPHVILTQTLAIAMLPYLCDLAARKDWQSFGKVLTGTLRILALIFVPLTAVMILLSDGIVQLAWDRGNWSATDLQYTATALRLYIWGLFFFAVENALMQSFFSTQRVWWPTILGIAAAFFHVLFIVALIRWVGFDYPYETFVITALSLPASKAFKNLALLLVARVQVAILPARETLAFLVKLAIVTAAVGLAVKLPYAALRQKMPLDALKERRLVVDTFNYEAPEWFTLDADSVKPAKNDDVKVEMGEYSLCVRYHVSGRRAVWVRRELGEFRISEAMALEFWAKCSHNAKLAAAIGEAKVDVPLKAGEWARCEVPLAQVG